MLSRDVTADKNPFFTLAVARWEWRERYIEPIDRMTTAAALGFLTVSTFLASGPLAIVLGSIDSVLSLVMFWKGVVDARELVQLASLETGPGGEVAIAKAEDALTSAWIWASIGTVLTAGITAVMATSRIFRSTRQTAGAVGHFDELLRRDPLRAEVLAQRLGGDLVKCDDLLRLTDGDGRLLLQLLDKAGGAQKLEELLDALRDIDRLELLLSKAESSRQLMEVLNLLTNLSQMVVGVQAEISSLLELERLSPKHPRPRRDAADND